GAKLTTSRLGFDLKDRSFLPDAAKIVVPTLLVQNKKDPWTNLDMVQAYFDELTVEKEMRWLEIEKNRFAAYDFIGRQPADILSWFDKHV
ncbi:MAG: alpha/beta hydrolase, partial [Pseudomonadota bacterium]